MPSEKEKIEIIKKYENIKFKREKEREFEDILNIPKGHIIIDTPIKELFQSEPRMLSMDLIILDF